MLLNHQVWVVDTTLGLKARLHQHRLARKDGVSLNQWIAAAVAQEVGAVETVAEFFRRRGEGAKPGNLCVILARVPNRAPDPGDELPEGWKS